MRRLDDIYHDTVSRVLGCLATESAREAVVITDTETGSSGR